MLPLLLFILILLVSFAVMLFMMRPSRSEKIVEQRLGKIGRAFEASSDEASSILKRERLSDVDWLNDLLLQIPGPARLKRFLSQADSSWTVGQLLLFSLSVFAIGTWFASFAAPSFALALLMGLTGGMAPYVFFSWKRSTRFNQFDAVLPEAIDLMSRALRAGHGIVAAIEMISQEISEPVAGEFRRVFEEQNFGLPLREAMLNLAARVPLPDVQFLVTAILVQKETGGNLAEVLDKTTLVIRERSRLRGQLRIHTAQGKITGWILGCMPFGLFAAINVLNPGYARILLEDPLGIQLIYAGLGLMALGVWTIRKVIDIKV